MSDAPWLTTMYDTHGSKTAIRLRPRAAVAEARKKYSNLLVVTHNLAKVRGDGMPDPDYDHGLMVFDCQLIEQLDLAGRGVVVETCGGKRMYYAYVDDDAGARERATRVLSSHGHLAESNFRGGPDPNWRFYTRYMEGPGAGADP